MADEQRIKCPHCGRTLVVEATIKFPELPHAVMFGKGCPACHKPFIVAKMAEGLRAYTVTRTSDIDGEKHVGVPDPKLRRAARKAAAS